MQDFPTVMFDRTLTNHLDIARGPRPRACFSLKRATSIGELTRDTAGAAHSLSCGTTDREALDLLESFHRRDTHRGGPQVTFVERSSSSRGLKVTMLRGSHLQKKTLKEGRLEN